ncbi:hypothetical protein RCG19_06715 [Neobacillus sp. OS1-2]|uniref:hypothetical protein n=1 Tax=Neobacillus sp. OS1-2 TaxID=3070680 RepID=UPI0027DF8BB9|nr:hypothetical protein [Neobacillus sp. OS1-2]WML41341.1 hypothetical protein RCG19_06715 [Neobacillus sp. OS1-2]
MKTKQSKTSPSPNDTFKKNILFINVVLFAITAFFALVCFQYSNVIPNQSLLISVYIVLLVSLGLFIYGFWLRNNIRLNRQMGIFSSVYCILVSILLFLTANILYTAGVEEGTIVEEVHYFSFSLLEYLIIISILSVLLFILSSPKVLNREIKTAKAYVWASVLGIGLVIMAYIIMIVIMNKIFTNPDSVKDSYEILAGSVGFGYIGCAMMIVIRRSKTKGTKNNG